MKYPQRFRRRLNAIVAMYIQAWKKCSQRMSASNQAETASTTMNTDAPRTIDYFAMPIHTPGKVIG